MELSQNKQWAGLEGLGWTGGRGEGGRRTHPRLEAPKCGELTPTAVPSSQAGETITWDWDLSLP